MTDARADSYVLLLNAIKNSLNAKTNSCVICVLPLLAEIQLDPNYAQAATILEKSNIESIQAIITACTNALKDIVWE